MRIKNIGKDIFIAPEFSVQPGEIKELPNDLALKYLHFPGWLEAVQEEPAEIREIPVEELKPSVLEPIEQPKLAAAPRLPGRPRKKT